MDSSVVNRAIRAEIRPLLKDAGFEAFTSRTSWRYHPDRVDVINFQSYNSYNAGVMGVTTYSFAVNLGCYLRYIPYQWTNVPATISPLYAKPRPMEYQCHMRGRLSRSYPERAVTDGQIWFIDELGSNTSKALHDVRMVLAREGIPWFSQFTSPNRVYAILYANEEQMDSLWGFGRPRSPIRRYYLGYVARAAGLKDEARTNLMLAAETQSFVDISQRLRDDAQSAV
jgi:hypothetical protein